MKNLVLSMLAIASITAMNSCSSESDPINEVTGGDKVEIKINAGVVKAETKAPVDSWGDGKYVQFAEGTATGKYTDNWYAKITGSEGTVQFLDATGELASNTAHYYESNGAKTYLRGFYPQATNNNGIVTFTIPETADTDIMVSDEQSGDKTADGGFKEFTFRHLLTQIKFKIKAGDGFPDSYVLKSLTLKGTKSIAALTLSSGTLTFSGGDLNAKVVEGGTTVINTTGADLDEIAMVEPGATMTLDITAGISGNTDNDRKYENIAFTTKGENGTEEPAKAGTAYTVTLTFSDKEVQATAGITPWSQGTGEGTVQ